MAWYQSTKVKVKVGPYSRYKSNWLLPNRRERWKCPTVSTDTEAATTLTSNPVLTISSRWVTKVSENIDYLFKVSLLNIWKQPNKVKISTNWRWSPLRTGTECGRTSRWPPMSLHSGWTMPRGCVCLDIFLSLYLRIYMWTLCLLHLCVLLWFCFCSYVFLWGFVVIFCDIVFFLAWIFACIRFRYITKFTCERCTL